MAETPQNRFLQIALDAKVILNAQRPHIVQRWPMLVCRAMMDDMQVVAKEGMNSGAVVNVIEHYKPGRRLYSTGYVGITYHTDIDGFREHAADNDLNLFWGPSGMAVCGPYTGMEVLNVDEIDAATTQLMIGSLEMPLRHFVQVNQVGK